MKTVIPEPTPKQREKADWAVALTRVLGNGVYQGTVTAKVKASRRAANRGARQSRLVNRRGA